MAKAASSVAGPLHILVSNAGVMAIPELARTRQGHGDGAEPGGQGWRIIP
ncbi:MAG TPA: hypothetical protein VGG75_12170 [Trebonia sp.]